jgi:hypothetical protein
MAFESTSLYIKPSSEPVQIFISCFHKVNFNIIIDSVPLPPEFSNKYCVSISCFSHATYSPWYEGGCTIKHCGYQLTGRMEEAECSSYHWQYWRDHNSRGAALSAARERTCSGLNTAHVPPHCQEFKQMHSPYTNANRDSNSSLESTEFPNTFLAILQPSLFSMLIYCTHTNPLFT